MIRTTFAIVCAALVAWFAPSAAKTSFVLHSKAFADGGTIPIAHSYNGYGCTGENTSPELSWSGAPSGTKSYALTIFDPDANHGKGWWHWIVYDIPSSVSELAEGAKKPGAQGRTDFGTKAYGGPCPPPGDEAHHYRFTLYALDEATIESDAVLDGPQLLDRIGGHVLGKTVLVGRFGR